MAQQVEHVLGKDEVTGSNPVSSSKKYGTVLTVPYFLKCDLGLTKDFSMIGLPKIFCLRKIFGKRSNLPEKQAKLA